MKRILGIIVILVPICVWLLLRTEPEVKGSPEELKTPAAKLSYAIGQEIGVSLKNMGTEIDLVAFMRGVEDNFKGSTPLLGEQEADQIKQEFFGKLEEKRMRQVTALAETNKQEGEKFLAENKNKPGVITTASGLQYVVLTEGTGPNPRKTDQVKVHYQGTLLNGTVFDSSYQRGEPIVFPLNGIPGWIEALQLMKVGSKHRLFIPSNLAYGENGAGPMIGPNATLIFEVELLAIEK